MKAIFGCTAFALVAALVSGIDFEFCPTCFGPTSCDCSADVILVLDRTGSVTDGEFNNVREVVKDYIKSLDYNCFRTSAIYFSDKATVVYTFDDPEGTDPVAACAKIDSIPLPSGRTDTGKAFVNSRITFLNSSPPPSGGCKVMAMFTDGGSDDKGDTLKQANRLRDKTQARLCVMGMQDPNETQSQKVNRLNELVDITQASFTGSSVCLDTDYTPANFQGSAEYQDVLDKLEACVCLPCFTQQ